MKRRTKLGLFGGAFLLGTIALSSCTSSFCSTKDKAHMMYAFDFGVTAFYSENNAEGTRDQLVVDYQDKSGANQQLTLNIYTEYSYDNCPALLKIKDA